MTARRLHYAEESRKPATGADYSTGVWSLPKSLHRRYFNHEETSGNFRTGGNDLCCRATSSEGSRFGPTMPAGKRTLHGTYMTQGTGSIVGVGPMAAVGVWTFDGEGNQVLTMTFSLNGVISRGTLSGPYTVKSDCTMTLSLSNGTNYDGGVAPDGNTGYWMATDPGTALSGTFTRLGHRSGLMEE